MAEPFLIGEAMTGGYGPVDILHSCTIAVEKGQIAVIVGPNGAGKSTAMKAVFGMLKLRGGHVRLAGEDITALTPQARVAKGMAFVPQTHNIFTTMTVEENLEMGAFLSPDDIKTTMEQVYELFPILKTKRYQAAGELSGGQRQQVAVGRALMTRPRLMMMDEPSLGLAPLVVKDIFGIIRQLSEQGITILLIEQNANAALHAANYGYVMQTGAITLQDTGEALLRNQSVQEAYLGHKRK